MVASALITAGATLLGGLFAPKPKYVVPDYAKIRSGAEAAGFNPLTALTQGPQGAVVQPANVMGSAIADAGLMLADSLAKSKKSGVLSRVQSENAKLREQVTNMTLRPKVAGVYARQQSVPSVPSAVGVSSANANRSDDPDNGSFDVRADASVGSFQSQPTSSSDDASKTPTRPLSILGYRITPQSGTSDAEAFASRYGEDFMSPSWFAGWGGFIGDSALGIKDAALARVGRIGTAFANDMQAQTLAARAYKKPNGKPLPRPYQGRGGVADRTFPPIGSSPRKPPVPSLSFRDAMKQLMAPRPSNYW